MISLKQNLKQSKNNNKSAKAHKLSYTLTLIQAIKQIDKQNQELRKYHTETASNIHIYTYTHRQ